MTSRRQKNPSRTNPTIWEMIIWRKLVRSGTFGLNLVSEHCVWWIIGCCREDRCCASTQVSRSRRSIWQAVNQEHGWAPEVCICCESWVGCLPPRVWNWLYLCRPVSVLYPKESFCLSSHRKIGKGQTVCFCSSSEIGCIGVHVRWPKKDETTMVVTSG